MHKRLLWKIFPSHVLVMVLSLLAIGFYTKTSVKTFTYGSMAEVLAARGRLAEAFFGEALLGEDARQAEEIVHRIAEHTQSRVTVINPNGKVLADSSESPLLMDNHIDRPEVRQALDGETGMQIRHSHTVNENMMYVAIPIWFQGEVAGVVRTAVSVASIEALLFDVYRRIALAGIVIALVAIVISLQIARAISRPLEEMKRVASRFADGDFSEKVRVSETTEIGSLAETMNTMAAQLDERIRELTRMRDEETAMLSSMVEGVIAVDSEQRIILINQAAARLDGSGALDARGRHLWEVFRNPDLQGFVEKTLATDTFTEGEITLAGPRPVFLQLHGSPLRDFSGAKTGAVIVLNDVTRLQQLENIRRDFVANVSHELRTPITSIKGFVETLQSGAIHNAEDTERFLAIIARQANRLNSIIEDLLSLSRIERDGERHAIPIEPGDVRPVINAAVQACEMKASEQGVVLVASCEPGLRAPINPALLEQALVNLIDNAVKYSPQGKSVDIVAESEAGEIVIRVHDNGIGIADEHLPRLFERFYRVDKARSRTLGGTGLGLAIVKHIVQAHGGRISVESAPGQGSTFTLRLPASEPST